MSATDARVLRWLDDQAAAKDAVIMRVLSEDGISLEDARSRCSINEYPADQRGEFIVDGVVRIRWGFPDPERPLCWILDVVEKVPAA